MNLEDEMKKQIKKIHKDIDSIKSPKEEDEEKRRNREILKNYAIIFAMIMCPLFLLVLLVWVTTLI